MTKIREILESLYEYAVNSAHNNEEYDEFYHSRLDKAETEIKKAVEMGVMELKKEGSIKWYSAKGEVTQREMTKFERGYNQAIIDMLELWTTSECKHENQPDTDGHPYCRKCGKYAYSDTYKPIKMPTTPRKDE